MSEERQVQQVLAKYVRATDARDDSAMKELYSDDGRVEIFNGVAGRYEKIGELVGKDSIAAAVSNMMKPHPARGWSHHTTFDPIIEINGLDATIDAQFVVYNVVGAEKPATGWPKDASGCQGVITPIESGYYFHTLKKIEGTWKIVKVRIRLDLPVAIPEA
jgi:hypothetical protein